jgi:Reverse transcriptase (RNA-dependent DNA polymerase)
LLETLQARGFEDRWRKWIQQLLETGQTNILINGQSTPFFYYKKGLRQGYPLSLFLFILVVDTC